MENNDILDFLYKINPQETVFRSAYFLAKNPGQFSAEEARQIRLAYSKHPLAMQIEKSLRLEQDGPVDLLNEQSRTFFFGDVGIVKHMRYLPVNLHQHEFFEIPYILEGSCVQTMSDKSYTLKKGDFCFISPHQAHSISVFDDETLVINILVKASSFQTLFFGLLSSENLLSSFFRNALTGDGSICQVIFHTAGDKVLRQAVLDMIGETLQRNDFGEMMLVNRVQLIFITLLREYLHTAELTDRHVGGSANITEIVHFIQKNYHNLTLPEAAKHFSYSESYFSRMIKKYTGQSFSEIIRTQRLNFAERLLRTTDLSMQDIALQSGFSDVSHFYRQFRCAFHETPVEFRAQVRRTETSL